MDTTETVEAAYARGYTEGVAAGADPRTPFGNSPAQEPERSAYFRGLQDTGVGER